MNTTRNLLIFASALVVLALPPARGEGAPPEGNVAHLLVSAPLDADPAGARAEPVGPHPGHLLLLLLPPALVALAAWSRRKGWLAAGVLFLCMGCQSGAETPPLRGGMAEQSENPATAGQAGETREAEFLWDQATAQMTRARTSEDFIQAAQTYRQLVAAGIRNQHVFYNLGTAWLKAGRPQRALDALERAERYAGTTPEIRHNMAIARHALGLSATGERPLWQRVVLFWHFSLSMGHRMTVALWAYATLWLGLFLRGGSYRRLAGTLLALSLPVAFLFGTSASASLLTERNARRDDHRGIESAGGVWQAIDPRPTPAPQKRRIPPTPRPTVAESPLRSNISYPASHIPHPASRIPHPASPDPNAPRLPHPLAPDDEAPPLAAALEISPASPYLYETFTVTLSLRATGVRLGQSLEISGLPPSDDLPRGPFRELPFQREADGDKVVEFRRYRFRARASTADLPPLQLNVLVSVIDPERDYAPDEETLYRITTAPLPLRIRPLPQADRPALFSGAVGKFSFDASLDRPHVRAHEPVDLVMHIQGEGDLSNITPPGIRHAAGCRLAAPEPMQLELPEQIAYRQTIIPQHTNLPALPPVTFSYFDPKAGRYVSQTAGPFALRFDRPRRQARFAPSHEAEATFVLPPGATPTVRDRVDGWVKVQDGRRIGWLPATQL